MAFNVNVIKAMIDAGILSAPPARVNTAESMRNFLKAFVDLLAAQEYTPDHDWDGTKLRFTRADGVVGNYVELRGLQGIQGIQGVKGDTGAVGPKGDTGSVGPKGDKGDTGAKGDTGSVGPKGDKGDTGAKGDTGSVGPKGDPGTLAAAVLAELAAWLGTDRLVVQQADSSIKKIPISLVLPIGSGPAQISTNNMLGTAAFVAANTLATLAGNNVFAGDTTLKRIISSGNAPSIAVAAGAGGGASATVAAGSTDMAGTITLNTGSSPNSNAVLATITFASAFATAPRAILLTARNNQTGMAMTKFFLGSKTANNFSINSCDATPGATTAFQFDYIVIA